MFLGVKLNFKYAEIYINVISGIFLMTAKPRPFFLNGLLEILKS